MVFSRKEEKKVGLHSEKERIYSNFFSMEINSLLIMVLLSLWQTANSILIQNQIRKKKLKKEPWWNSAYSRLVIQSLCRREILNGLYSQRGLSAR